MIAPEFEIVYILMKNTSECSFYCEISSIHSIHWSKDIPQMLIKQFDEFYAHMNKEFHKDPWFCGSPTKERKLLDAWLSSGKPIPVLVKKNFNKRTKQYKPESVYGKHISFHIEEHMIPKRSLDDCNICL